MGITCNSSPTLQPPQPPSSNMKLLFILGLVALGQAVPQRFRQRQGRQETGYLAPAPDAYGAPAEDVPSLYAAPEEPVADASELDNSYLAPEASDVDTSYLAPAASDVDSSYLAPGASEDAPIEADAPLDSYGAEEDLGGYGELDTAASDVAGDEADPLKMLMNAVPGVPGEDYPIFSEAPESGFACDGQVDGGYYADEEAQCQVFHICTADGAGGLAKYSFLCPNGTIFNQNYFICDWWFNVDCAESAALAEAKNSEIAAAREEASAAAADEAAASELDGAYAAPEADTSYAAPSEVAEDVAGGYLAPAEYEDDDSLAAYGDAQASYNRRY